MIKWKYSLFSLAIFEIAKEQNKLSFFQNDLKLIREVFEHYPKFYHLLISYQVTEKQKKTIIEKTFTNKINHSLLNALLLIVEKGYFFWIKKIIKKALEKISEDQNIYQGIVYSTSVLHDKQIEDLQQMVKNKYNINADLHNVIDKSLKFGIKICVKDLIIEDTLHTRIANIRATILGVE